VGARGAEHVEVVVVLLLLHPLVVAWGLHGGIIRGGLLIACWSGLCAMRALSRQLETGGQWRLGVLDDGVWSEVDENVSRQREKSRRSDLDG
jgi:hypothetical protein